MKLPLSLLGVLAALSTYGHASQMMHESAADFSATHQFDSNRGGMVEYNRFWARARGQDIVRELIGSVKLLRVSRRILSTPEHSNQFAYCKAVVTRNVGNFCESDTSQRKCSRTSSLCVFSRAIPTASSKTRREVFFLPTAKRAVNRG